MIEVAPRFRTITGDLTVLSHDDHTFKVLAALFQTMKVNA